MVWASYIRIESIANIFSILTQFALVALVTVNKNKYLYALTGAKLVLCIVSDTFLVSTLPVSANLGVNGIGYSNIIVNALTLVICCKASFCALSHIRELSAGENAFSISEQ